MNISWEWQTWSAGRARSTVVRVVCQRVWRAKPEQHRRCLFFFTLHPYNAGAIRPHRDSGTIFPRPRVSWPAADKRTQVCQADSMSVARADVLAIKDSVTARPYHRFSRSILFFLIPPFDNFCNGAELWTVSQNTLNSSQKHSGTSAWPGLGAKFRFPCTNAGMVGSTWCSNISLAYYTHPACETFRPWLPINDGKKDTRVPDTNFFLASLRECHAVIVLERCIEHNFFQN